MDLFSSPKFVATAIAVSVITFVLIKKFSSMGCTSSKSSTSVVDASTKSSTSASSSTDDVIVPNEYRKFRLIKKQTMTSGQFPVKLFRFEIPGGKSLNLPTGQHISIRFDAPDENGEMEEVKRSYTPTSSNDDKGFFDLVVKLYPQGKMSKFLEELEEGKGHIEVAGPKGSFVYKKNMCNAIGMIAGGSGITPMLQVINEILKHSDDKTKVTLLFGNVTEEDIILRQEIDNLAAKHDNFIAYNVLNKPPEGWTQGVGFITADMIKEYMPAPNADHSTRVLMCGPPPMLKVMRGHLDTLGYTRTDLFTF